MTIQRNSNHILDLNRILKRKPHTFSTGDEIQVPSNTQKTYNVDTSNNFSVNTLDSNGLIKSTKAGGQNDALKNLADKNQPVPTSDGYFGQDGAYNKGKNVAGAISAVAGGLTGMYAGYKGNSTIADTSGVKKQANSIASNSSNAESNDALLNDMNSFNAMNNVSYGQVRGVSNGDMAKNTLNSVASGASAGSVAGPWGAAIGAVVGLGTGVAGIFSGNSKARREKARLNGQIAAANQSAINNFANTASNINTNTNINLGRNYFAQGGHVFAGGGKNDKYIDSNERYLMDYAQSKAYRNRLSKYTSDPNILNYAPNAAANELKSNFSSFVFPNANNFDNAGETYTVNKNKFYTGYDQLPQYLKGVIDDRWNSQPKDVRYALENHDRVVSVPTLTYSNDFYDMMGVRHPDMFKPLHHETGHFLDPFLNNQYPEEYKLYLTPDVEMFKSNLNKEHDSKISENYADLMELRAKLHEANVFDSSDPNAVFDLKKLNEFRKYLKKQKQGSNFLNNHNDGQIINAINKIAYNDNGNNGNQNVFANGGHLFSTGGKYNTWWNPNDFNFALHLKPSTAHSDKVDNMLINYLDAHYKQLSKLVRDNNMSSIGLGKYVVSKLGLSRRFLIGAINACAWRIFQNPDDVSYKPSKNVTMIPVNKSGLEGGVANDLSPNASYYIATTLPGSNVRFVQYVVKPKPKPLVIKSEPELVEPHQLTEPSKKVLDRTTQQWVDVPASWNYGDPYPQGMIHPVGLATSPQPNSTVKWKPTPNKVDDNSGIRFDTVNQEYFDKNNKIVGRDINNNTETLVSKPTTPKYQFKSYQDVLNNKPDELANKFAEGGHIFKNGGKANKTSKSKKAKHVVLQTDYTKPVIDNYGRVFYPFSSGVVVDDKSSGLKPEIGKSGFVEHDVNQTLSGIQFDKNGNVVKNTYKESPSVNDDTRIPITSSPSVLPNGERREEPYEPTDEQQYYRHVTNGDDVDFQERSMAAGLALAGIPFGGWYAAALNVPQALYTWKHRDETSGVNQFLDYASVIPGMKFTKALNLSKNPAIIRSARLAARVTKKAHPSDIAIRSKQFAAPVAALQMVHKAGDAQNVLTYPSLVKDWFNRQLIDTRFDNYLDSSVKPLILNKFADGGDIDEKKAVETPGQWERRYVNSPEFEKRYKSILYHGADVPSLQDIRDQVNNTHYLHVNFDNGMGSRQMVPLNVRTNVADTYDYGLRHKNEFELSHYVKPVGKGNPWIVEDTRPYPATADFTKDNVMPHEHGHVIDFNNYLSTAEYNDDGSTQPDPKYMFDANRKPVDKANSSISYSHDSKEAENYADINALKYNLYKFGIKDIANGDIVTIDDIRKFKDIINKMPVKQRNAYNRIFYLFDDDAIVRFLNKLADSNNHPDVNVPSVNVFAEGGDLDYDAIKQSYNDSNTGYSKFNHSSGWIKDYMRDHMKTGLVADGSVDAATMKGIKKANMNMNMFYTANGTDGEEMSNNVDYGWVKKNNPSQLYQYENQNLPTNGDKVQQSNLGSSTSSKAAKKAAPINVSKSKFYANIQQETKANPQLNETMSIAYNYLIKKGFKPVNASAIVGCIYAESRMNPQQDNGDHCGLLQWTKFKTENNKKKFGDRYNKLIEHTKQLEGDKYKDGDENLLLNQLAFVADDLRSKDFNNDKVKLIHTLSKSQSIYDSAKAIMEIYGGDDKDKYSPTERAAYALYCLKNISTMKQDNNKDKK